MRRAWRRRVTDSEVEQKLALVVKIRPECDDFSRPWSKCSPPFLHRRSFCISCRPTPEQPQSEQPQPEHLSGDELATRLSMFLWCSAPDEELLNLAALGQLSNVDVQSKSLHLPFEKLNAGQKMIHFQPRRVSRPAFRESRSGRLNFVSG